MAPNIPLILHAVLEDYALPWDGDHGIAHWARVRNPISLIILIVVEPVLQIKAGVSSRWPHAEREPVVVLPGRPPE
jgi:hypothetical protein